jgi:hypothetical protein
MQGRPRQQNVCQAAMPMHPRQSEPLAVGAGVFVLMS